MALVLQRFCVMPIKPDMNPALLVRREVPERQGQLEAVIIARMMEVFKLNPAGDF